MQRKTQRTRWHPQLMMKMAKRWCQRMRTHSKRRTKEATRWGALLAATARGTGSAEEAAGAVDAAGSVLPLLEVADVAEMHKNRAIGYSGTEVPRPAWMFGSSERAQYPSPWQVPLTAEQELRNAKTGAARATPPPPSRPPSSSPSPSNLLRLPRRRPAKCAAAIRPAPERIHGQVRVRCVWGLSSLCL